MQLVGPAPTADADAATKEYVDQAVAPRIEKVTVDFGADDTTAAATAFATWVRADTVIRCVPDPAGTADHGAEDAILEGVTAVVTYIEPGVGFDIVAVAPGGTWGRYLFTCIA